MELGKMRITCWATIVLMHTNHCNSC